jgi:predicted GIY-YIG superfamily endonuclease
MISPEKVSLNSLPSTMYQERSKLPSLMGIYFVVEEDRVIYIGASRNLRNRLNSHDKGKYFNNCRIFYLALDVNEPLFQVEKAFIQHHKPQRNSAHAGHVKPLSPPIDGILLSRKEAAEMLDLSVSTLKGRGGNTECLIEIRQVKTVQFIPSQVAEHRNYVWSYGRCDGRCKSALTLRVVKQRAG